MKKAALLSMLRRFPKAKRVLRKLYYGACGITDGEISGESLKRAVGKPNPVVLEIGCNDGGHTLWFKSLFPDATIHCFEPDPRAAERFRRQLEGVSGVSLHEIAISGENGQITFYQSGGAATHEKPEGYDASGSIRRPKNHALVSPEIRFEKSIVVPTMKLDDWTEENGIQSVDFIWMDVQGAEFDVIAGGRKTFLQTRYLYTECNEMELYEGQSGLRPLLKELSSFRVVERFPQDVFLRNIDAA